MKRVAVKKSEDDKFCTGWFDMEESVCFKSSSEEILYKTRNNKWVLRTKSFVYVEVNQALAVAWMIDNEHETELQKELISKYEI